jgi:hypothetical protein
MLRPAAKDYFDKIIPSKEEKDFFLSGMEKRSVRREELFGTSPQ